LHGPGSAAKISPVYDIDARLTFFGITETSDKKLPGNQAIVRVMLQLRKKIQRVINCVSGRDVARLENHPAKHRAIAESVSNGSPDQAAQAFEEHLQYAKQQLLSPRRR
jgi:DNA-binding FadR family transcriptional regulator